MTLSLFALMSGTGVLFAQIAWNRQLLLLTGGSLDSTAIVLTAFMTGLALGGAWFGRLAERSSKPLNVLRITAFGVSACSLIPLLAGPLAGSFYPVLYSTGMQIPARLLLALVLVSPATFFAGGMVPAMARLTENRGGVSSTASLYGLHALGSALGGFLAGFVLLETAGTALTLLLGAALTTAAALLVKAVPATGRVTPSVRGKRPGAFFLWVYFGSGAVALCWEMVWTRQLTFVLGNSTYAFATMGIMVLAGIGAGSIAGRRFAVSSARPLAVFGMVQVLLGVASVLPLSVLRGFHPLSAFLSPWQGWTGSITGDILAAFFFMIPSTFLMGVTFPLMVRAAARENMLGEDVGILSMANCFGAALGPLLASQVLFRFLGVTPSVIVLACLNSILGLIALIRSGRSGAAFTAPVGAGVAVVLAVTSIRPGYRAPETMQTLYFSEGRTATVAVFGRDWDGHRSLRINGVEEVPVDQASLEAFYLLGHLPWGYNPDAQTAMAVAMGGGITSGAILSHPVETLVCAEICPEVAEAASFFERWNGRPDLDPRFTLVGDDGRNFLLGTLEEFDLIICDATHPGSSESWLLYTEEFYAIVSTRLAPGGIAAQWVPLHRLPVQEFRRILVTWSRSFEHSAVHSAGGRHAILIGSDENLELNIEAMFSDQRCREQLEDTGYSLEEPEWLQPMLSSAAMEQLACAPLSSNTDDLAPCQFLIRKCSGDPQLTIGENMSMLVSLSDMFSSEPLHTAQVLYWSMRLPDAVAVLRDAGTPTALERRWLSAALSSAAELLYNEGRYTEATELADAAWEADPGWPRNMELIIEINRAMEHSLEDY